MFDDKLKMEFFCNSYPIRGQWGHKNSVPRFYLKVGKEIIWDFPKDFEVKDFPFYFWADNNNISDLIREYIDTPLDKLLNKKFKFDTNVFYMQHLDSNNQDEITIEYKLTDLFKATDRRLGNEKIKNWALNISNQKVDRIIELRFSEK